MHLLVIENQFEHKIVPCNIVYTIYYEYKSQTGFYK